MYLFYFETGELRISYPSLASIIKPVAAFSVEFMRPHVFRFDCDEIRQF